jgi:outer membrane protein
MLDRRSTFLFALLLAVAIVAAAPATAQIKVAVIDVQTVVTESALGQQAQKELEQLQGAKRGELEARGKELADLRKKIEEGRLSLAPEKLTEMSEEFESKGREFQRAEDDANRELQKRGEKLMGDIEVKILPIIDEIGKAEGYTLIFNKFRSGLLFADDAVDITKQVIDQLNAKHPGS